MDYYQLLKKSALGSIDHPYAKVGHGVLQAVGYGKNGGGTSGGKLENNETIFEGLERECQEEIQFFPQQAKLIPIQKFVNNTFTYHTFFCPVENEFLPVLNEEHIGYCWVDVHNYPKPLHPGLFNTVNFDIVKDKLEQLTKVKE